MPRLMRHSETLRRTGGNEGGVIDEFWIPGGKTSGGVSEGVVDLSNPDISFETYPF